MSQQKSQAISQRRNLVLEAIRRLSNRSGRWITVSEIVEDLKGQGYAEEIHTIRRDVNALLGVHPQLEVNDNSKADQGPTNGLPYGYRWVGKDHEPAVGLTLPEALSLIMVERYLAQSLPILLTHSLQDIFTKAHKTLELHRKNQVTQWPDKICIIQPAQPFIPPNIDQAVLTTVHEALLNEKQLAVVYMPAQSWEAKEKTYRLHPLGLIQRGPVTYLAAMANDYEEAFLYALHRIRSAQQLDQSSRYKDGFNLSRYAETQGHFGNGDLIHLKARISDHLAAILEETPLSDSQKIRECDLYGYKEISATMPYTWQLRWWLLSEGERVEVLEPEDLRQEIARTLRKAGEPYFDLHSLEHHK
jgi:predicted DNA-binding transcriptional regulator YafY